MRAPRRIRRGDGPRTGRRLVVPRVDSIIVASLVQTTRRPGRRSEEELRAIYDQRYVDQYDPHAVQRMRRMLPLFELSGREKVADFGCGSGVLAELISDRVGEYVGVDFSEAFVREARRRQA